MCDKQLEVIKKQFFCGVPVTEIDWKDFLEHLSWEDQELFIQQTVDSSDNILHPLRVSYQKAFVKYVLDRLGTSEAVHDVVYNAFGRLVATPNTGDSFKHYRVSEQLNLILKENANFISEGTTGLCTWQAGIALAEWCVQNQEIFKGKTVIELGSGIGLTSLTVASCTEASKVVATDCHESVLANLKYNIKLNFGPEQSRITALALPWEAVEDVEEIGADLILAADVVYDDSLFDPLINAVKQFLRHKPQTKWILACTERNSNTLGSFLRLLGEAGLGFVTLSTPDQKHFLWPADPPVRLYQISLLD